tara:strand:+ start:156493 stop:156951 length:459 start_codon:yes stop_codon:yes gene_type:complete
MPKTYNDITKQTAWTYYVIMGMSAEEISGLLEPTATTIREWAKDEDWDSQKSIRLSAPSQIALDAAWMVGMIYRQAKEENRILTSKEIDQVSKHNKLIEKLDKNFMFVASAIEAQGLFMQMVRKKDEELFLKLIPHSQDFTQEVAKKYGGLK